jgi:uncharacterized protein YjaZ
MSAIKHYIANAHDEFDAAMLAKIELGFKQGKLVIEKKLKADKIDIIFVNAPASVIPEIGVGGFSPGPFNLYVSLNPNYQHFLIEDLVLTIIHEAHHCMRWRGPGYGETLGEAIVSEGLASLFEQERSGRPPIYNRVNIKASEIKTANKLLNSNAFNHSEWFFGSKDTQRWFGYTYGYQLCKAYSEKTGKTAAELVHAEAKLFLGDASK